MKVLGIIPGDGTSLNPKRYLVEVSAYNIRCMSGSDSTMVICRGGKDYTIDNADNLTVGDEIEYLQIRKYKDRIVNVNENGEEIKKAISQTRRALTRLENIIAEESDVVK